MKTPYYDYMIHQLATTMYSPSKSPWIRGLANLALKRINKSRIFKIPRDLSNLFILTDPEKLFLLPYEVIFLEQYIKIDNFVIKGILLYQLDYNDKLELENPYEDVIFLYANIELNGVKTTTTFLLSESQKNREKVDPDTLDINIEYHKHIENLVYNFLCFVNSPDIEYVATTDSKRDTEIRLRKGKPPRPTIASIKLTNPLKRYINNQKHGVKMVYSHRFWVRGHWRTLRHIRYGKNRGKKIWIKPYVKGDGLLIQKNYELVSPEVHDDR